MDDNSPFEKGVVDTIFAKDPHKIMENERIVLDDYYYYTVSIPTEMQIQTNAILTSNHFRFCFTSFAYQIWHGGSWL